MHFCWLTGPLLNGIIFHARTVWSIVGFVPWEDALHDDNEDSCEGWRLSFSTGKVPVRLGLHTARNWHAGQKFGSGTALGLLTNPACRTVLIIFNLSACHQIYFWSTSCVGFFVCLVFFPSGHRHLDEILHNFELITVVLRAFILFLRVQTILAM